MNRFAALVNFTLLLTLMVIALGAYTRLTDAGLGCPDWPGCYGKLTAPLHAGHIVEAQAKFPDAKIELHKAHNEMLHRYIAGLLGLCVLAIAVVSQWIKCFRILSAIILSLVIFQAALGMWTVTLNLLPLVVLAHLLGGFALLSLLALLRIEIARHQHTLPRNVAPEPRLARLLPLGYLALSVLIAQIILGGWTSTNYAAAVCYQLPFCEAGWVEHFSVQSAFNLPLGHDTYEHGVLPYEARMSIHVLHRMGAIITLLVLGSFAFLCWRSALGSRMRLFAGAIAGLLLLQLTMGLINVVAQLPLLNAVGHNLVAANLLMLVVVYLRKIVLLRPSTDRTSVPISLDSNVVSR
ncbi:MAG TPA: COX15/CtaA family protein [Cellvibrio sp.]|nr:COX15/CtaA family protein [Cellvibrio sp.]